MEPLEKEIPAWALLPVGILCLIIGLLIRPADRYADLRGIELREGMTVGQIEAMLGKPDSYERYESTSYYFYGPFLTSEDKPLHRLSVVFDGNRLSSWTRKSPD